MRIFTSSWFTPLPPDIQKIGISRGIPRGYPAGYRRLPLLAPGKWFNPQEYHQLYMAQLALLDPQLLLDRLYRLGEGRDVALLCYEAPHKPEDWCHRGQVAGFFGDTLGIEVFEFGYETHGSGWRHPKLLPEFKK